MTLGDGLHAIYNDAAKPWIACKALCHAWAACSQLHLMQLPNCNRSDSCTALERYCASLTDAALLLPLNLDFKLRSTIVLNGFGRLFVQPALVTSCNCIVLVVYWLELYCSTAIPLRSLMFPLIPAVFLFLNLANNVCNGGEGHIGYYIWVDLLISGGLPHRRWQIHCS